MADAFVWWIVNAPLELIIILMVIIWFPVLWLFWPRNKKEDVYRDRRMHT